jgi:aldose 1-epimerase
VEPPSGRQFELRFGTQRAVVVEVGGGLREYTVDGQPVIDGYALDAMADGGRGHPLLPWPNRLADGRYEFGRRTLQLPIDEVDKQNAIHGLVRWANWSLVEQSVSRVRLGLVAHPRPGYPFTLQLEIGYALSNAGMTVRIEARNLGREALPFGAGQHPYFTVGTPLVDQTILSVPARSRLELDSEQRLPTGRDLPVENSDYDFRAPRVVGSLVLDDCFTDLSRDADGRARIRLRNPPTGQALAVWLDEHYKYAMVFSGDTLAPERRRQSLAIEPMTCPPNAFRSGIDLTVVAPGAAIELEWGIELTIV